MEESIKDDSFLKQIKDVFAVESKEVRTYSPLTLAYLGDAVYELIIRSLVVSQGNTSPNRLNKKSSQLAKASSQALMMKYLKPQLSERELSMYKTGRNAKSYTKAKNASHHDYREATGFECLMGYLYLMDEQSRILSLVKQGLEELEHEDESTK